MAEYTLISIRLPPAWVDYIDYLVDSGYYGSRSDFIRESIRDAIRLNKAFATRTGLIVRQKKEAVRQCDLT